MTIAKTLNELGLVSHADLKALTPLFAQVVRMRTKQPTTVTEFFALLDECKRILADLEAAQMETVRGEILHANLTHSLRKFHESLSHINAAQLGHATGTYPPHVIEQGIAQAVACWDDHREAIIAVCDEFQALYDAGKRAVETAEERKAALDSVSPILRPARTYENKTEKGTN